MCPQERVTVHDGLYSRSSRGSIQQIRGIKIPLEAETRVVRNEREYRPWWYFVGSVIQRSCFSILERSMQPEHLMACRKVQYFWKVEESPFSEMSCSISTKNWSLIHNQYGTYLWKTISSEIPFLYVNPPWSRFLFYPGSCHKNQQWLFQTIFPIS